MFHMFNSISISNIKFYEINTGTYSCYFKKANDQYESNKSYQLKTFTSDWNNLKQKF